MFSRLFRRDRRGDRIASLLYGAIVAQARMPALYSGFGVPDSVEGRFEMLVLHLVLVTRRLKTGGQAGREVGQEVFDLFCRDMDNSLREMGVGDLSVPKRMREVGEVYFGRMAAYEPGLAVGDVELITEVVGRTVYQGEGSGDRARTLAEYCVAVAQALGSQEEGAILAVGPAFPNPQIFVSKASVG